MRILKETAGEANKEARPAGTEVSKARRDRRSWRNTRHIEAR
jgi:hypothetical protein